MSEQRYYPLKTAWSAKVEGYRLLELRGANYTEPNLFGSILQPEMRATSSPS
jgi:hypothetical protein